MATAWISFLNPLPIFFVKECLYYLASIVGKSIQFDKVTTKKSRPSASVKVLVYLKGDFSNHLQM